MKKSLLKNFSTLNVPRKLDLIITFILLLLNLVMLGAIFERLYFRFDITMDKKYSLSKHTLGVVKQLKSPLNIKVFFSPDLPAPYNSYERYLRDLLGEYRLVARDKIKIEYVDLRANPNSPKDFGIYPVAIQIVEKDQLQYKNAYMGLVFMHGDMVERIPRISSAEGLEYRITAIIKKMVDKINRINSLETNFEIFLIGNDRLPVENIQNFEDTVASAILNVKAKLNDRLEYRFFDSLFDPRTKDIIKKFNFPPISLEGVRNYDKRLFPGGKTYFGIIVKYKENYRVVNLLEEDEEGNLYLIDKSRIEVSVMDAIENILAIKKKVGYIIGHGEPQYFEGYGEEEKGDSISRFASLIDETYDFQPISILKNPIPDDIEALLIVEPKFPFEEKEKFRIDQFIMSGKPVIFFVGGLFFPVLDRTQLMAGNVPKGVIPRTGLFEMISNYGVIIDHNLVLDKNCYKAEIPKAYGGGYQSLYYYPIVEKENISQTHEITKKVKGMFLIRMSSMSFNNELTNRFKVKFTPIVWSGKESWSEGEGVLLYPSYIASRMPDSFTNFVVAGVVEGELPSFFEGKNIKNLIERGSFISKSKNSKLVFVCSGDMAKNLIIDIDGNGPNSVFVRNIIDWALDNKDLIKLRIKGLTYNPPKKTSDAVKAFIKWFNTFGTAAMVVIVGIILWQLDLYRRRRIKQRFLQNK